MAISKLTFLVMRKGVFKHEMAKQQCISVFQKGRRNVCLKCPKISGFQNPLNPARKHSTHTYIHTHTLYLMWSSALSYVS